MTALSGQEKRQARGHRPGRARAFAGALALVVGPFILAPAAQAGPVLPTGAVVKAGTAAVSAPSANQVTVTQTSSKAIIDWTGFSIGQGGTVQFNNGAGATLNRVTGTDVSSIDGLLSATGSVYLINPNGVVIGKTGVVNTGGSFVASTLDVSNTNFLAGGDLTFAGTSSASVVNVGKIGALGGDVALVAAKVDNQGSITAANGAAGLIAGYQVVIHDGSLDGGKFAVLTGGPATSATNTGAIAAAEAELRANGGNVYALAGNTGGVIKATGVAAGGGKVMLYAEGGTTTANGEIDAVNADGSGGQVETSGASVNFDGLKVKAANWLIDPTDLTVDSVAAATISANLAGTSVTLQTTASGASGPGNTASGAGDININAPISWSSGSTLTLDANNSINVNAPITVAGPGKVAMTTTNGGLNFALGDAGFTGSLSFTGTPNTGQSLTLGGQPYTLLYSLTDLAGINGSSGNFALARPLDASSAGVLSAPLVASFDGHLSGLGNVVSNMTINIPYSVDTNGYPTGTNNGLVGTLNGSIGDIGVVGGSTSGGGAVGGLVGTNNGNIGQSYAATPVTGDAYVGGLVGNNTGTIGTSIATGAVTVLGYYGGGLVGGDNGYIHDSHATGSVTASGAGPGGVGGIGGLVGSTAGGPPITNSYATGAVSGGTEVGGLIGYANEGTVSGDFATGAVSAINDYAGGLIGIEYGAHISNLTFPRWTARPAFWIRRMADMAALSSPLS